MSEDSSFKDLLHSWHEYRLLALLGKGLGALLLAAGLLLVAVFEYQSIKKAQALERGAAAVLTVQADKIDAGNDGKLVHLVGAAETKETLTDPEFQVAVNALRLSRTVEMYQWQEKKESTKKKTETVVEYNYDRVWSKKPISSSSFHTRGHENPPALPFEDKSWQAEEVTVGVFKLSKALIDKIKNDERLPAEGASKGPLPERVKAHEGLFYQSNNPASPMPGDARVEFKIARPATISIVAKQTSAGLEPFDDDGNEVALVQAGTHDAASMFSSAQGSHATLGWVVRLLGFLILGGGLYLVSKPYEDRADAIPFVGDMMGLGAACFAPVAAIALTLAVSGLVLFLHNPVMAAIFIAAAGGLLVGYQKFAAWKMLRSGGLDKLAPEAAKLARSIRKKGGNVYIYDDEAGNPTVTVTLDGKKFTDDDVAALTVLPRLTDLTIYDSDIKGTGFAKLAAVKSLQSLSVRAPLAGNGVQAIGTLTGLKKLSIAETKINDPMLGLLKNLTALEAADLADTDITDNGLVHVKAWTRLKDLKLSNAPITGTGLEHCKDLKALESLWLSNTKLTDNGLAGLRGLTSVKELWIGINDNLTGVGLAHLQGMTRLEKLDLSHSPITDAGLPGLQKLVGLKELNLERTKISDAGIAHLRFLRALEKLDLYRTGITDKGLPMLLAVPTLKELSLDRTKITDAGLAHLGKLPNLSTLHLDHTEISDAGLAHLKKLANLSWLTVSNTKVTQAGADDLQNSVSASIDLTNWRGMLDELEDSE